MTVPSGMNGIIIHAISGFYYVEAAGFIYECKAKGTFRKLGCSPLVGDRVVFEPDGDKGFIVEILQRKNFLTRPPVANIDALFIVASADRPKPNLYVIDKQTAFAVYHGIEPVIVFSKTDLENIDALAKLYRDVGLRVFCCSSATGEGVEALEHALGSGVNVLAGNSGVGKSSLLNALLPQLKLQTNDISDKLGRGRHTTRSVRLYPYRGGYVADTPGFSSFDFEENGERIMKDELADCFPEFEAYVQQCRFYPSCSHTVDKGCAVRRAVEEGRIPAARHQSYMRMYEEVRNFRSWQAE